MKFTLYSIFIVLVLSSCQSIKFDRYPGTAMQEFPENLRGKYTSVMKNNSSFDTISVYISKDAYTIFNNKETEIDFLDSMHVFSEYQHNYFLFVKEDAYWSGYSVKKNKKGITVLNISVPNKGDHAKNLKLLSKYFTDVKLTKTSSVVGGVECTAKMDEKNLLKYLKKNKRNKMNLIQVKE